uniref:Uncharacterized protein n=1 Tax=Magallana gigas TaxID=29159 RepID=K1QMN8_MAGGI
MDKNHSGLEFVLSEHNKKSESESDSELELEEELEELELEELDLELESTFCASLSPPSYVIEVQSQEENDWLIELKWGGGSRPPHPNPRCYVPVM